MLVNRPMIELSKSTSNGPDLLSYDYIVINSSGGKDSQAMTHEICAQARALGILHKVIMVHANLGRVEWEGAREIAELHAATYGIQFFVVRREKGDLLQQIEELGMFPDNQNRYCTSDQKRDQVAKLFTTITRELFTPRPGAEKCRILNCMGIRAQESSARAKKIPFQRDARNSNGKRDVDIYYPIFNWTLDQVWNCIRKSGVAYHFAYDLGMPRLSCCFCIFAPREALILAGKHNTELLREYVRVEKKIGHTLRKDQSLAEILEEVEKGTEVKQIADWNM